MFAFTVDMEKFSKKEHQAILAALDKLIIMCDSASRKGQCVDYIRGAIGYHTAQVSGKRKAK